MSATIQAIVYALARAVCDAYFDARAKYEKTYEEKPNHEDIIRAHNFGNAVTRRMQSDTAHAPDTRSGDTSPCG